MGRTIAGTVDDEDVGLRWVAQLKMLHSLAARLNGLNEIARIGEAITGELKTLIDYHACRVYLLQPDGETLYPIALRGEGAEYADEDPEELKLKVGEGLTGHAAEVLQTYYTPDAMNDPFAETVPGTDDIDESILAVPLTSGRRLLGMLTLSKRGIDEFDAEDVRLLELLASHASVALENARLLLSEREAAAYARESEARKTAILESALDAVIVIDGDGTIQEFSSAAERTFDYTRADAIGRELAELIIPPDLREQQREALARAHAGDEHSVGTRLELDAIRADGSRFPVEVAITRVQFAGSDLYTAYVRDITDRRLTEEEVRTALQTEREAVEQLRALDEMKDMFLQAVSHDLRTPLTSILGITLTLDQSGADLSEEDGRDLRRRLATNARRLDSILSNLLDLERLKRGVIDATLEPTDVGELVRRMVAEADFLAGREVNVRAAPVSAMLDAAKAERIVENLLVNAAKHTPPGTPIWVEVRADQGTVLIVVEDSGPGIPVELREAVFEPFRRGSDQQVSPGTGIGLSLVSRFAELHGGRASVEPRDGGGASFRVRLPLDAPAPL